MTNRDKKYNVADIEYLKKLRTELKHQINIHIEVKKLFGILKSNNIRFETDIQNVQKSKDKDYLESAGSVVVGYIRPPLIEMIFEDLKHNINDEDKYINKIRNITSSVGIHTPTDDQLKSLNNTHNILSKATLAENEFEQQMFKTEVFDTRNLEIFFYKTQIATLDCNNWNWFIKESNISLISTNEDEFKKYYLDQIKRFESIIQTCESHIKNLNVIIGDINKGIPISNIFYNNQIEKIERDLSIQKVENGITNIEHILGTIKEKDNNAYLELRSKRCNTEELCNTPVNITIRQNLQYKTIIVFKALNALLYRALQQGEIQKITDKTTIKTSQLWEMCPIAYTKSKGYDSRGKTKYINAIDQLLDRIIYSDSKRFLITSILLNFEYNKQTKRILFQIDSNFLVDFNSDKISYYYSNHEGLLRLMKTTKTSEKAFYLHNYLEHSLKSNKQSFNFSTLITEGKLSPMYNKDKTRAKNKLFEILNKMKFESVLIYNWELIPSDSDQNGKFVLYKKEKPV